MIGEKQYMGENDKPTKSLHLEAKQCHKRDSVPSATVRIVRKSLERVS